MTHRELKKEAICWLIKNGCWLVAEEFSWGDISDAVGLNYKGDRYMIEAKVSRNDLLSKKQKNVYERTVKGITNFDFYYIIVSPVFTVKDTDYPLWGFIQSGKVIRRAKRILPVGQRLSQEKFIELVARKNTIALYKNIFFPPSLNGDLLNDPAP